MLDIQNTSSRHPVISTAQGYVQATLLGPNRYSYNSSIYKNRSTQQEYGDSFLGQAAYWSFGKSAVQFRGTSIEGQLFDSIGSTTTNTQPRKLGDVLYRSTDFVPGTNGPIRVLTYPATGRSTIDAGGLNISTTATIATNASTGTANFTGFNPLASNLQLNDNLLCKNCDATGALTVPFQVTCIDGTGSGTVCAGLGAQGIVASVAPGCIGASTCPAAGAETVQWQIGQLGDFGFEATWGSAAPSSGTYGVGRVVWNTNISSGQPIYWICSTAGTPGTWTAGPLYGPVLSNPMTTQGDIIYSSSGTGTASRLGIGTAGQVLTVNSGATAPSWQPIPTSTGDYILSSCTAAASGAITGTSAAVNVYSCSVPANAIPTGGCLRATAYFIHTGSTSVAYVWNFGATATAAQNSSTSATTNGKSVMMACALAGSSTSEFINVDPMIIGTSLAASGATATASQDYASGFTVTFTFNVANTDSVTPKGAVFEVLQP